MPAFVFFGIENQMARHRLMFVSKPFKEYHSKSAFYSLALYG
jgi:hypothetical protein